jgi:hypothetical protein
MWKETLKTNMSDPKPFDPIDPISAAMGALHGQNLLAAKDARIKQLEELNRVLNTKLEAMLVIIKTSDAELADAIKKDDFCN